MEYRFLGRTGTKVSELCMGTMTFGWGADEPTSHRLMDRFAEAGGNFVDTADNYGPSEDILGRWLKSKRRDDWVVATKVFSRVGEGPNDVGSSRRHILAGVEASLRRLRTDYIDLYFLHQWDWYTRLEDTLSTLHGLVQSGKVRYVGASNMAGWQLQKALDLCGQRGWEPFSCLEFQYSLLCRSVEWEIMPLCAAEGLGMMAWSPLRGGWLSGKYLRSMQEPPDGTRAKEVPDPAAWSQEATWRVLDAVRAVAAEVGKTPAQVALNWLLRKPVVTIPIVGARNLAQLEDNLGAAGWALTPEQVEKLDDASALPLPPPYDYLARMSTAQRR